MGLELHFFFFLHNQPCLRSHPSKVPALVGTLILLWKCREAGPPLHLLPLPALLCHYMTFLFDYLTCSLLITYHTYLTLTYALIGSPWFNPVQLSKQNKYHAACFTTACVLPAVGRLLLIYVVSRLQQWCTLVRMRPQTAQIRAISSQSKVRWTNVDGGKIWLFAVMREALWRVLIKPIIQWDS